MDPNLVAERAIYGRINGRVVEVMVRICRPERIDAKAWRCCFTFHGVDGQCPLKDHKAIGIDAVQALIEALNGVGAALDRSGIEWSMFAEKDIADGVLEGSGENDGFPRAELSLIFSSQGFRKRMQVLIAAEQEEELRLRRRQIGPAKLD